MHSLRAISAIIADFLSFGVKGYQNVNGDDLTVLDRQREIGN